MKSGKIAAPGGAANGGAECGEQRAVRHVSPPYSGGKGDKVYSRTTMRDVARRAKVSLMTVSNVVNGKLGTMSAETRSRVEDSIRKLNYRPHFSGRNLRLAQRLSIGMIVVDRTPTFLADPFTTRLVAGLSNYLSERGYALTLQGLKPEDFANALCVRNIRTDGLCAFLSGSEEERRRCIAILRSLGQPIVLFQESRAPRDSEICLIRQDDRGGAAWLAKHVISCGARKLMMLVPENAWPAVEARRRGIEDVVSASGKSVTLKIVQCGDASFASVTDALGAITGKANRVPDAVLAANDQMGIAAMKFFRALGIRIPEDILITGFNGFEFRLHTDPILTSVMSPAYEMGARGGEELLSRIQGGAFTKHEITLLVTPDIGGTT